MQNAEWHWWRGLGWRVVNVTGLVVGAAAVLSPWAIRNYRVFGKPIVTTTHGGYTLYLANNFWFYKHLAEDTSGMPFQAISLPTLPFRTEVHIALSPPPDNPRNELETDRNYLKSAWLAIRANPSLFCRACMYRLAQLWSPLPHRLTPHESTPRRLLRYATCLWYCGVYLLAAVGVWKLRWNLVRPPWLWGVLLCLAFTAVHTFYWTNLRMRAPLMPFVALVAAAAMSSWSRQRAAFTSRSASGNSVE